MSVAGRCGIMEAGSDMRRLWRNLIQGASTALVLMPPPYRARIGEHLFEQSDLEALQSDWIAIGNDLRKVLGNAEALVVNDGKRTNGRAAEEEE